MHIHTGFAIAAVIMIAEAIGFWTITGVVETIASVQSAPTTRVIHVKPIALPEVRVEG
jgi:hypothetical protein